MPPCPARVRYDPETNPTGARPTVFDAARNIYGVNPATGAALRPYDNVGVQYGLNALKAGVITVAQFLDLNERIGGYDEDANYTATRTIGDADAIRRAYQSGLMLGANGGLTSIPIFDNATSNESGRLSLRLVPLRAARAAAQGATGATPTTWRCGGA